MLKLIIVDDEGRRTVVPFIRQEITIGRQEGNTIRLTERNVSRHHARLVRRNGSIVVEDLGSYNGVRVNGERIEGMAELHEGDRVQIGDYQLAIDEGAVQTPHQPVPQREFETQPGRPPTSLATASPRLAPPPSDDEAGSPDMAVDDDATLRQPATAVAPPRFSADLDPENAPRLIVLNTDLAGREFPCVRTDLKVGRSSDNDIVLDHESLSPTQARLMREPSGEWQIVDLESTNGVFVNGQAFGVARLRDGDLLELGEVKLKFVATPASAPHWATSQATSFGFPRNRSLIAAAVLLLLVVGIAYFLMRKESAVPIAERPASTEAPAPTAPPIPSAQPRSDEEAVAKQQVPPAKAVEESAAPAPPRPDLEAKLRLANAAIAGREFEKAIDILESIKSADGLRPEPVNDRLARANAELSAKKKLSLAQKSLSAGKLDETFRLLEESAGTAAFANEHAQLKARAEASSRTGTRKKDRDLKLARVAKPEVLSEAEKSAAGTASQGRAARLLEEGTTLYRQGQYTDAAGTLSQCLKVDPAFARCHMALAATYAKLKEPELGAQHYRRFVQLAPDDPQAPRVKVLLEQYESSKTLAR